MIGTGTPSPHEVVRHRVPQRMRDNTLLDPGLVPQAVQERPNMRGVQRTALEGTEQPGPPRDFLRMVLEAS